LLRGREWGERNERRKTLWGVALSLGVRFSEVTRGGQRRRFCLGKGTSRLKGKRGRPKRRELLRKPRLAERVGGRIG